MPDAFLQILPFVLAAAGAGVVGGLVAQFWNPGIKARSAIQHFAAGAILAAIAADIIPEVERTGTMVGIVGGLIAGGLVMSGLKWSVLKMERSGWGKKHRALGLAAAATVDTLLDGAITGAGFTRGQHLGGLLVAAFALELFFLTLSVGSELRKGESKRWLTIAVPTFVASMLLVGATIASIFLQGVSETTVAIVLAFGSTALIYLIAEELLVETIQAEESISSTMMLFAGFVVLMIFNLLSQDSAQ